MEWKNEVSPEQLLVTAGRTAATTDINAFPKLLTLPIVPTT